MMPARLRRTVRRSKDRGGGLEKRDSKAPPNPVLTIVGQEHRQRITESGGMNGETAQLQRLTDEQVNVRLSAYNADGLLEQDIALLRDQAGDLIEAEVGEQFGKDAAQQVKAQYAGAVDAAWVQ